MPTVPTYGPRKVQPAALPGARRQAAETDASRGGQVGAAQAAIGAGVARMGVLGYQEIQQAEQDRAAQIEALAAGRQLGELKQTLLYSQDRGALHVKGKDTLPLLQSTLASFDEQAGLILSAISTDRAKLAFLRDRDGERLAISGAINQHTTQQLQQYDTDEVTGFTKNMQSDGIAAATDPPALRLALDRGEEKIREYGARNRLAPAAVAQQLEAFRSSVHVGVIERLLALPGRARYARSYFDETRDQIAGAQLARLETTITAATTDAEGERVADALWTRLGPASDSDPISLDRMEAEARAQHGSDTETLKATIAALRVRKQGVDDGRRERTDAMLSTVWGAVAAGQPFDQVRRLPAYLNAPGKVQLDVRDYYRVENDRRASQAYTLEARASTREQRLLSAEAREERQRELDGWAAYFDLAAPARLRSLSQGDILAQLPILGHAHVNRLLTDKERITKDDETFRAAVIDKDLFNEIAHSRGLSYVYTAPQSMTPTQRANLGKLQATVEDEIGRRQVVAGRRLTRDETSEVMVAIVDAKVMLRDTGLFFYDESQIAAIVNEQNRAKAYVPIAQISDGAVLEHAANYLRGAYPQQTKGLSNADIKARYAPRIERAYALRLMGGTKAEIEAALKGDQ